MNVLIIAAHPDDEVLGAGGTIARHCRQGDDVTIAILGEGITSRHGSRKETNQSLLAGLKSDAKKAGAIMGCEDVRLYDLPDNRFDSVDLLDVIKVVKVLVDEKQPELIYTHHYGDLNIDHVITARAVLTACRPLPGSSVRRILSFEVPSSTGWGFPNDSFTPTVFFNISDYLQTKVDACRAYRGEMREFPHARSIESIKHRAKMHGTQVGFEAAEAFHLIREIQE